MQSNAMKALLLGGLATFVPTDIAGLKLWLDASDVATITDAGGGAVSAWADKSGNGFNFGQATGVDRPITGVTTRNGKNVLDFAASDLESSVAAAVDWKFLHDSTGSSIFMVFHLDALADQIEILGTQDSSAEHGFALIRPAGGLTLRVNIARGVSGGANLTVANASAAAYYTEGAWFLFSHIGDPNNGTAADRSDFRKDGGASVKNNTLTNAPSSSNPSRNLGIGKIANDARRVNGSIAEIIIYSGILSAGNRAAVEAYLSAKWAVP